MKTKSFGQIVILVVEFIIFIDFWVILAVSIWGGVSYKAIRLFGTYFESNNVFRPLIIWVITIGIWRLGKSLYPERIFINIFKNPYYYFITIIILYSAFALPVHLQPYYTFSYDNAHDFAARHHAVYNSSIGNLLRSDIFSHLGPFRNWNYLGDNFSLMILVFVPIYIFFKNGVILLVIQSIAIILAAIPIFLIANEKIRDKWASLIISLSYLFYPLTIRFPFYEFRLEYLAIPMLLFAFYYIQKGKVGISMVFLILVALCREIGFLAVAIMGVYIFFCGKQIKHKRIIGLLIFFISVAVLSFIVEFIIPKLRTQGFYGYGPLGGKQKLIGMLFNPIKILSTYEPERVIYLNNIFKYLGYIPLMSPLILLLVPFLLQNWLTDIVATVGHVWHSALIVPFLFIATIYAMNNISRLLKNARMLAYIWLSCFMLFCGIPQYYEDILKPFFESKLYLDAKPIIYKKYCKAEQIMPKDKSVFTHFALLPNLSNREKIYWNDTIPKAEDVDTDYLFFSPKLLVRDREIIDNIIDQGRYVEIYGNSDFIVMGNRRLYYEIAYLVSDFKDIEDLQMWEINTSHCDYRYNIERDAFVLQVYFDGDPKEDEFLQMRKKNVDVDLKEYSHFFLEYKMDNDEVQTIEIVFGIDFTGDGKVDSYLKGFYVPTKSKGEKWVVDLSEMVHDNFLNANYYKVVELELYPHKIYGADCSDSKKGWYNFTLGRVGFYNAVKTE